MTLAATFAHDDVAHSLYLETVGPFGATQPLRSLRHLDKLKSGRCSLLYLRLQISSRCYCTILEFWFVRTLVSLEVTFRLISFSGCYFTSGWKTIIIIWPQIFVLRFDSAFQNQPRSLCRVYAILDSINKILVAMVTESANNHLAGAKSASASFRCFQASQSLTVIKLAQGGKLVFRTRLNKESRQTNIWLGPWCIRCACRLSSNAHLHVLLNVVKC